MKHLHLIFCVLVGLVPAAGASLAGTVPAENDKVGTAIETLKATIDVSAAQERPRIGKRDDGFLRFFGAPPGAPAQLNLALRAASPEEKAVGFLTEHAAAFGSDDKLMSFVPMKSKVEGQYTFLRLSRFYAGIPVFSGEIVVQLINNDIACVIADIMTTARYEGDDSISVFPVLAAEDAELKAVTAVRDAYRTKKEAVNVAISANQLQAFAEDMAILQDTRLVIYDPAVGGEEGDVCLAWHVTVGGMANFLEQDVVLINAYSGEVALLYSLLNEALDRWVGEEILDEFGEFDLEYAPLRQEGDPPTGITDVDDCYDMLGDVYDFYNTYHGRDSIDDQGQLLVGVVDVSPYADPWWQAYWVGFYEIIVLGEGIVVDDVIGHELTHGVIHHESGLLNYGEAGAIGESLSDVWGEFIDLTNGRGNDSEEVRWQCGEDYWREIPPDDYDCGPVRYMDDPMLLNHPDRMNSSLYPANDVHEDAGVNNKLCYLLTDGDTFRDRTISEMGISLVADLYYACHPLLTSEASYYELYDVLGQAAVTLGLTEPQRKNIEEGCRAVEIRPTKAMTFKDSSGAALAQFTDGGDLILIGGEVLINQTITASPTVDEFIVKTSGGTLVALLDLSTGNLKLKGKTYEAVTGTLTPPADSLIIKQGGDVVSFITSANWTNSTLEPAYPYTVPAGSLILSGHVVEVDEE